MMIKAKLNFLDKINFLGIRIWDFAFRSLSREYSWLFLFKIILKYPLKSLKGLLVYRKFCNTIDQISPSKICSNISCQEFITKIKTDRSSLLVAMGYCQRPLKTDAQPLVCPSERFSHSCYFIETHHRVNHIPSACSICEIKPIAEAAIKAGASFQIMTSARDITRDIFIPALDDKKIRHAILFICPYSILLIILPLFICGIKFMIIPYATGDCRDYADFVRADMGIKPKRTFPSGENFELVLDILKTMGQNKNNPNQVLQQ
jgi:hypothetical protein